MAKQKQSSNKTIRYLIGGLVLVIIFLVVASSFGWIGKPKEIEVEMAKAKRTTIVEKVSASGTIQPVTEIKLAPEVSGEIRELLVEEGDSVKEGALLVKIRPDTWISQLEGREAFMNEKKANEVASQANLTRAEATFTRAEQEYKRQERLWNEKVISEAEWQLAQQDFKVAENNLKSARQDLQAARYVVKSSQASVQEALEKVRLTKVLAPMSGIVSKLNVKLGERMVGTQTEQGTEMMRIADLRVMEVRVNVNENDIVRVHVGDTAVIDVDAYSTQGKEFKGIVTLIANTAKDKTSADAITEFEVRVLILSSSYQDLVREGSKFPFRPGMTASVDILTNRKENVLSVPLASVTTRNPEDEKAEEDKKQNGPSDENNTNNTAPKPAQKKEDKTVIFINDKGTAKMIEVKTGISDYDNIEVITGVSDSTDVITGPFLAVSKRLKDGDKVRKMEKTDPKDKEKDSK
jgi:HlyD family secretion protein